MAFKLIAAAAKTWRKLSGENPLPKIVQGAKFGVGVEIIQNAGTTLRVIEPSSRFKLV
jgi:hypothetical protein